VAHHDFILQVERSATRRLGSKPRFVRTSHSLRASRSLCSRRFLDDSQDSWLAAAPVLPIKGATIPLGHDAITPRPQTHPLRPRVARVFSLSLSCFVFPCFWFHPRLPRVSIVDSVWYILRLRSPSCPLSRAAWCVSRRAPNLSLTD
jgi:hypothetical protein